jgi:chorismate mutase/prephenate dehydrogenase
VTGDKPIPEALLRLRDELDSLDQQVLELLKRRMAVVTQVAAVKRVEGVQIRDFKREREMLDERRRRADQLGLSPASVESIYRQILLSSRDYQAALGAAAPKTMVAKDVAVIGGAGQMGTVMARMFRDLGHRVVIADLTTEARPQDAAAGADVVLISVPIQTTLDVIGEIAPHVRPDALLMDITSVKQAPMAAMLQHSRASVVGTHPMFGPGVHTLQGQRVVVCPGRGDAWCNWVEQNLQARGLVITRASAEEHDRAMALVQVLTHFQTQVLGWALARCGVPLEQSRRFTSPAYLMELYVAARHFAQDPMLYGPIEMLNPDTKLVTTAFRQAAQDLSEILERGDQDGFNAMFVQVRDFFGEFAVEATEQSSFLIDRLVERTIG